MSSSLPETDADADRSKHDRRSSIEEAGYLQDRVEALARLSTADPRPALRMSAEQLYADLKEHGSAWYGSIYERHALLEKPPGVSWPTS
jgi:hypothetical protein